MNRKQSQKKNQQNLDMHGLDVNNGDEQFFSLQSGDNQISERVEIETETNKSQLGTFQSGSSKSEKSAPENTRVIKTVFLLAGRTGGPIIPAMAIFRGLEKTDHVEIDAKNTKQNSSKNSESKNKLASADSLTTHIPVIIGVRGGFEDIISQNQSIAIEYLPQAKLDILSFKLSSLSIFESLKLIINTFFNLAKLVISFIKSIFLILNYKPNLIVATGSFLGIPMVIVNHALKKIGLSKAKVWVHQQDPLPSLSNKVTIGMADFKTCVFESTKKFAAFKDCEIIPNPVDLDRFDIDLIKQNLVAKSKPNYEIESQDAKSQETNHQSQSYQNSIKSGDENIGKNYSSNPALMSAFAIALFFALLANYLQWSTYSPVYIMPIFIVIGLSWNWYLQNR